MSERPPIPCLWTGDVFEPLSRAKRIASEHYGAGEVVRLVEHQDRSARSHDHFFAVVSDVFDSLPEAFDGRWASAEHLRKWALIKAGYRDERTHVCGSKAEAVRTAALVKAIDDYAVAIATDAVVSIYTAKSQSKKAMGAKVFQASKDAVLKVLSDMIGVEVATLHKHGQGSAGANNSRAEAA